MGLFEKIFKKEQQERAMHGYFKSFTAYNPTFSTFEGGLYEMDLTRAAVHTFAEHCSKLKPEVSGLSADNNRLRRILQYRPNMWHDASRFLYRLATITEVNNNATIAPVLGDDGTRIEGYFPLLPSRIELVDHAGECWVRYTFSTGKRAVVEFSKVGLITKMQYEDDIFGSSNAPIKPTIQLLDTQRQGIVEGIKSSAAIRFMARLAQVANDKTIADERRRFREQDLAAENNGGVMIFDTKYADVKQIDSKPYIVDADQRKRIEESVFYYFNTNEKILTNSFTDNEFNAYYEGKIEAWALKTGLALTNMTYTPHEISFGNAITLSSNRLQYASNDVKLKTVVELTDRGMMSRNEGREIFQMAPVPGGDEYFIRGEYVTVKERQGGVNNAVQGQSGIPNNAGDDPDEGKPQA